MANILFRADSDTKSGTGDLLSLIYLSEYFKGWNKFFITKDTTTSRKILKKHNIKRVKFIDIDLNKSSEISLINKFINSKKIDAFFLEITRGSLGAYRHIDAPFKGCVDFFGKLPKGFDLVINWDVGNKNLYNLKKNPSTQFLLGPRYALMRKDIIKKANNLRRKVADKGRVSNILISFGGFDKFNFSLKIAKSLERFYMPFNIRIILGSGYSHRDSLDKFIKKSNNCRYRIYHNISSMIQQYQWADMVIGAGGLSLFEVIALRIPAAIIATHKHQIKRCVFFDRKKIIRYSGFRRFEHSELLTFIKKRHLLPYREEFVADKIPQVVYERLNY